MRSRLLCMYETRGRRTLSATHIHAVRKSVDKNHLSRHLSYLFLQVPPVARHPHERTSSATIPSNYHIWVNPLINRLSMCIIGDAFGRCTLICTYAQPNICMNNKRWMTQTSAIRMYNISKLYYYEKFSLS